MESDGMGRDRMDGLKMGFGGFFLFASSFVFGGWGLCVSESETKRGEKRRRSEWFLFFFISSSSF